MVKELGHLVSFDKVTLFTNILLDETINLAAENIFKYEDCQKIQLKIFIFPHKFFCIMGNIDGVTWDRLQIRFLLIYSECIMKAFGEIRMIINCL